MGSGARCLSLNACTAAATGDDERILLACMEQRQAGTGGDFSSRVTTLAGGVAVFSVVKVAGS